jgi:hypothetical protein
MLGTITLSKAEAPLVEAELTAFFADETALRESRRAALSQALAAANARLSRLTDLLLDGAIDAPAHDERRSAMVLERQGLLGQLAALENYGTAYIAAARQTFELLKCAETLYETTDAAKKRQLLEIVFANCMATGKTLDVTMREPFATISGRAVVHSGGQFYDTDRTFLVKTLISWASSSSNVSGTLARLTSLEELVKPAA